MDSTISLGATTVCYPLSVDPVFTLDRALQGISSVGLKYVELVAIPGYCAHLTPESMGSGEISEVKSRLRQYDLEVSAVNVTADLTRSRGVRLLRETMRVARALETRTIVTHVEHTKTRRGAARFRKLLPEIIDLANRYDVIIALETHGGLVTTGTQGLTLLKEVDSSRLRMTYDMANVVYYGGIRPEEDLSQMGGDIYAHVQHVHLKDKATMTPGEYDFPRFGEGILNFNAVLRHLESGGYQGHMSLEVELDGAPESPDSVDAALLHSYRYLQEHWSNETGR
jgi:sugar phosphate isomerase/epimerase